MTFRTDSYRTTESRLVAGIMSGTSLDGIDVALVRIEGSGSELQFRTEAFCSVPYSGEVRERILRAASGELPMREAFELDVDLGRIQGEAVRSVVAGAGLEPSDLDAVGMHGQTIYHAPRRSPGGVSVQIGNGAVVAEMLRTIVVSDFRAADVAAGGEGAPLVPYCDYLLFHSSERDRVALNIGGIANLTLLPRDAEPNSLTAFDTGPGNVLIDAAMRFLKGRDMDEGGRCAAHGNVAVPWLDELLHDPYYQLKPPKSTGREHFSERMGRELAERGKGMGLCDEDIIATLTNLTARTIADGIRRRGIGTPDDLIVGGGGAHNATLMGMLADELQGTSVFPADQCGISADAKEAICFAILANESLCGRPANVPSVTGASRPVILGAVRFGGNAGI